MEKESEESKGSKPILEGKENEENNTSVQLSEEKTDPECKYNSETNVKPLIYDVRNENLGCIHSKINRMNKEELETMLQTLRLKSKGKNDVLRKRLKTFYKEQKTLLNKTNKSNCPYKYLCVIDFEATCEANSNKDSNYLHEIIEFPAVLIETSSKTIVSEFREYCRPVLNKNLTEFCTSLTGITQDMVDKADTFPAVLEKFTTWMAGYKLGCGNSFAIVTDGPWDMNKFLVIQCDFSHTPLPNFSKKWVNVCKTFAKFYKTKKLSLRKMLQMLEMEFEGRKHCGLDDARNIARIVIHLLEKGAMVTVNERISLNETSSRVISESGGFGHKNSKSLH